MWAGSHSISDPIQGSVSHRANWHSSRNSGILVSFSGSPLRFYKRHRKVSLVEVKGVTMAAERIVLPQGTLDLLILRTLFLGPQHGWAISERVQQISDDALRIQQGSLYPALHRLERRGCIKAKWGASENNRRAKYYELTKTGQKQLATEQSAWEKLTAAVAQVLRAV